VTKTQVFEATWQGSAPFKRSKVTPLKADLFEARWQGLAPLERSDAVHREPESLDMPGQTTYALVEPRNVGTLEQEGLEAKRQRVPIRPRLDGVVREIDDTNVLGDARDRFVVERVDELTTQIASGYHI